MRGSARTPRPRCPLMGRAHLHVVGGEDAHAAVVLPLQPVPVHLLMDVDDVPLLQRQLPARDTVTPVPGPADRATPRAGAPPVPIPHPRDPRSDPGAHLGDSAWKSNLRRAAFIWGGRGEVTGRQPRFRPSQIPHGVGPSRPHLLLLPLDGLHGVSQVRQAGEGPWPESVCREGGVTSRVFGVPHGRAWGAQGG